MRTTVIPDELADLLERAARHPDGEGVLREASLECAAICLGAHAFAVEAARAWLESPDASCTLGAPRGSDRASTAQPPIPAVSPFGPDSAEAAALIEAARRHPRGLSFLRAGAVAEVAAAFDVHPFTVFRARGALERVPYRSANG